MTQPAPPVSDAVASEFADLVEDLTARFKAGEPVDLDALVHDHPAHADELRRLVPAMKVLADWSSVPRCADALAGADLCSAEPLGDYRLIREVGRGGMGVVYEAEQRSLGRRVALKVLPFAATMDPRQLQRFRHEAQAAALLHHPNIVPVYAVGCERGVHYYAMQLIEGQSLAAVIDEMRGECDPQPAANASGPLPACGAGLGWGVRRGHDSQSLPVATPHPNPAPQAGRGQNGDTAPIAALTTQRARKDKTHYRRLAELIAQAADALEYAHQQGVVHRDVKPANLMLDNAGHLWVTDFGLAKLDTAVNLTASGDLLGTLRYMSPEQALAKHGMVDHRTDIYSLGATLYELLTLRPAVDGADKQAALRQIAFEEPTPPRKLDTAIPPELETIALKALAKEPADRYPMAGELAADLRRWLSHQTIRARRPSLAQRIDKWMRRHSVTVLAAAAALLVGTCVSTWLAVKAREAELRAVTEASIARSVIDFLQHDLLQQVDLNIQHADGFAAEPNLTVREALDRSAARIGNRFQDQPLVEAAIRMVIGDAYMRIGEFPLVVPHMELALDLRRTQLGADHPDTLDSMGGVAGGYLSVGRRTEAIEILERTLEKRLVLFGRDDLRTVGTMFALANTYDSAGFGEKALPLAEQTFKKRLAQCGPTHPETIVSMRQVALALTSLGRFEESFEVYRSALDACKNSTDPNHPGTTSQVMFSYGRTCLMAGRVDEAERLARESLRLRQQLGSPFGAVVSADSLVLLTHVMLKQDRFAEAEEHARQAQALYEKYRPLHGGPSNWRPFHAMSLVGGALLGQKRYQEAERLLVQGFEGMRQRTIDAPLMYWLTAALDRVVQFYDATNQPEKAREWRNRLPTRPPY